LWRRKGVLRPLELHHLAAYELALAGAAAAGLAGKRKRHAGAQQRGKDRIAGLDRNAALVALEGYLHGPGLAADVGAIVRSPNKAGVDRWRATALSPASCQACSATGCASRSRRCFATSRSRSPSFLREESASCSSSRPIPA